MKIKNKGIENANAEAMSAKRLLLGSALALLPFAPHASAAADETILVTADAQNSVTAPVKGSSPKRAPPAPRPPPLCVKRRSPSQW